MFIVFNVLYTYECLNLCTLYLMVLTISKRKAVPWAQFGHLHMQKCSWENFKNTHLPLPFYCRFICNIFFLWNGIESELIKLIDKKV